MHVRIVLIALLLAQLGLTQFVSVVDGRSDFIPITACTSTAFKWTLSPAPFFFEFELSSTTAGVFDVYLSQTVPDANTKSFSPDACGVSTCTVSTTGSTCKVTQGCHVAAGDYYIVISYNNPTGTQGQFFYTTTKTDLDPNVIKTLPIATDKKSAVAITIDGGAIDPKARLTKLDFFKLPKLAGNLVDGTRVVIEISVINPAAAAVQTFLYRSSHPASPDFACFDRAAGSSLEIGACEVKFVAASREEYQLTVQRSVSGLSYEILAFYESPEVIQITDAKTDNFLVEVDDIKYFEFKGSSAAPADTSLVAVLDNVDGGRVLMEINYQALPFQSCAAIGTSCNSDIGCHVRVDKCLFETRKTGSWFIGIKALTVDNEQEPVTFTIKAHLETMAPKDITATGTVIGGVPHDSYAEYHIPKITDPLAWVNFHLYIDAPRVDETDAILYLSPTPRAGEPGTCRKFFTTKRCIATASKNDIKSCFLQLDPCELAAFPNGVYISVRGLDSKDYLWFQNQVRFTLETKQWSPEDDEHKLSDNSHVIASHVAEGQAEVYRVKGFFGPLSFAVTAADYVYLNGSVAPSSLDALVVDVVFRPEQGGGVSCKCYAESVQKSLTIKHGASDSYTFNTCDSQSDGIYIVVRSVADQSDTRDATEMYHYAEDHYVLTLVSPQVDTLPVKDLAPLPTLNGKPMTEKINVGDSHYYRLATTDAGPTKTLLVKSRMHPDSGIRVQLLSFPTAPQTLTCGVSSVGSCKGNFANDGYCTITKDCFFNNNANRFLYLLVTRDGTNSTTATFEAYSLSYHFVDRAVTPLVSGTPQSVLLQKDVYQHFTVNVPAADAKKKNLLIEAYFDAGLLDYHDEVIEMFVNPPGNNLPAGDPTGGNEACYCHSEHLQDKRKVVFTVNSCGLVAGDYKISLRTPAMVFDTNPGRVTIHAELQNPIKTAAEGFKLDFPFDFNLYQGQVFSFKFDLPDSMFTGLTDTARRLKARIFNVRGDTVQAYLSRHPPSDADSATSVCSCFEQTNQCDTGVAEFCEFTNEYCQLENGKGSGSWYLTVFASKARDPRDPVTLTALVTKKNSHATVRTLTLSDGCPSTGAPQIVTVDNKNYQHFAFSFPPAINTGSEVLEVRLKNIEGGSADVAFHKNNLATAACRLPVTGITSCTGAADCVLKITCIDQISHMSVYARSTKPEPIKFEITACYVDEGAIAFKGPQFSTTVPTQSLAIFATTLAPTAPSVVRTSISALGGSNIELTLTQSVCKSCGSVARFTTICNADCNLDVYTCQLPANTATSEWFVDVNNKGGNNAQMNLQLSEISFGAPQVLTAKVANDVTVPANGFKVVQWTASSADFKTIQQGSSQAYIDIEPTAGGGSVASFFSAGGATPQPPIGCHQQTKASHGAKDKYFVSACCSAPNVYTITFKNSGGSDATFKITPTIKDQSVHVTATPTGSNFVGTVDAAVNSDSEAIYGEVIIPFQGFADPAKDYYILKAKGNSINLYKRYDAPAGPTAKKPCFDSIIPPFALTNAKDYFEEVYSCVSRPIVAADMWLGFEKTDVANPIANGGNYELTVHTATAVAFGAVSAPFSGPKDYHSQFYVDIPSVAWTRRDIVITITSTNGGFDAFINRGSFAGAKTVTCLDNFATQTVSAGGNFKVTLPSCSTAGRYYIGVKPVADGSAWTIEAVGKEQEPFAIDPPASDNAAPGSPKYYKATSDVAGSTNELSYFVLQLDNVNVRDAKFNKAIWYRDGDCGTVDTSRCANNAAPAPNSCSLIVYPCQLQPSTEYHFEIEPSGALQYEPKALKKAATRDFVTEVNQLYRAEIKQNELHVFTVRVADKIQPGQSIDFQLAGVSCGTVEAWINRGTVGGQTCNINNNNTACTTAPCSLYSLQKCQTAEDDFTGDYHITVRGIKQNEGTVPIKVDVRVVVAGKTAFRSLHTMEKETIKLLPVPTVTGKVCPSPLPGRTPIPCCSVDNTTAPLNGNYYLEDVNLVYQIEGAHFLENKNKITLELSTNVLRATLFIDNSYPHFCATAKGASVHSCTADKSVDSGRCTISLESCHVRDERLIYAWVDPDSVVTNTIPGGQASVPGVFLHNHAGPYTLSLAKFAPTAQEFSYSLSDGEKAYLHIDHPPTATLKSTPNYRARVDVLEVTGGNLRLTKNWDNCANYTCEDAGHCVSDGQASRCSPGTPCKCDDSMLTCTADRINANTDSFLTYTAITDVAGHGVVTARLRVTFTETVEGVKPDECSIIKGSEHRFYHVDHLAAAAVDQIYKLRVEAFGDFSGALSGSGRTSAELNVGEGVIPLHADCTAIKSCLSTSAPCELLFRNHEVPKLSVYGDPSKPRSFYHLDAQLMKVDVMTLNNGVKFTSPFNTQENGCLVSKGYQYYKFAATIAKSKEYMLVELDAVADTEIFWYPGHVTYMWGQRSCKTDATGHCYMIFTCDDLSGDSYFMVSNTVHTITASKKTISEKPLTFSVPTAATIPSRELVTFKLPVSPLDSNPTRDLLFTYGGDGTRVDAWITHGAPGDRRCAVAQGSTQTAGATLRVTNCDLHKGSDVFYINFYSPAIAGTCVDSLFRITASFTSDAFDASKTVNSGSSSGNVDVVPGKPTRMRFNLSPLTAGQVVYVHFKKIAGGSITHKVYKPNNLIAPAAGVISPLPCPGCMAAGQKPAVSWFADCFHCGNSAYDGVFVEVNVNQLAAPASAVTVDAEVLVQNFVALSPTFQTVQLEPNPAVSSVSSIKFFKTTLDPTKANRIELEVIKGPSVEVQVSGPCGSPVISIDCFQGAECHIPLPTNYNYGSFDKGTTQTQTLAYTDLHVVVFGADTSFKIRHLVGSATCSASTPANAPFCTGSLSSAASVWGGDNTFLAKDAKGSSLYDDLVNGFGCPPGNECKCTPLSDPCKQKLKQFACDLALQPCDSAGFALPPARTICQDIQTTCGKSFITAGFPQYDCGHGYYYGSSLTTSPPPPVTPTPGVPNPNPAPPTPGGPNPNPPVPGGTPTPGGPNPNPPVPGGTPTPGGPNPNPNPNPVPGGTPTPGGPNPVPNPNPIGPSPGDSSGKGGNAKGLSTGALIAIIVIASVLALAAIGAAVYFLVIRPRQAGPADGYHDMGDNGVELY